MAKKMFWTLFLVVSILLGLDIAGVAKSSSTPVIRLQPTNNTAEPGQNFKVNATVTSVTEDSLYGWETWIDFNPSIINVIDATEGPFLKTTGYQTFWITRINNTEGTLRIGALFQPPNLPPNGAVGNGVLATITFKVVGRGTTSLRFDYTDLYTVIGGYNSPISHSAEDGSFSNAGFALSLELIVAIVVVVAVGGGTALLLYKRRRAPKR